MDHIAHMEEGQQESSHNKHPQQFNYFTTIMYEVLTIGLHSCSSEPL